MEITETTGMGISLADPTAGEQGGTWEEALGQLSGCLQGLWDVFLSRGERVPWSL